MSRRLDAVAHLASLGFSEIEADAYVFLVRVWGGWAYRVAQAIQRTAANTYKAMESLEARGAVMVEESDPRLYRAVPAGELLSNIERTFRRHADGAARLLASLSSTDAEDDRVYHLRDPGQVFARSAAILEGAKQVALLDLFPEPLAELRPALEACIARGVRVALLVYESILIDGATVIQNQQASVVRARWPGQWLNLAADSSEQVHALLTPDGDEVVHATWSASPFLAHLYQSGLLGELLASAIRNGIRDGKSIDELRRIVRYIDRFEHTDTPAFASLREAPIRRARRGKA